MSVYKNASSLMATSVPRPVSQLVQHVFFLLSLVNQTQATHLGGLCECPHCLAYPVLASGIMRMASVVHFVMLSLTYEFWAIFQNFSQGGYLHLQGLGGMQPGSQGWCLSASNEPARRHTKKYFLLHATFISVLGLLGLEGLPVVVLVSNFCCLSIAGDVL